MVNAIYLVYCAAMVVMAVVVFVSLYFVKAGYGMFRTRQWGWSISNKVAWVLMEAPAFAVMLACTVAAVSLFGLSGCTQCSSYSCSLPALLLAALYLLHYTQRSFIFPFLMTGKSKMPVSIMLMGVTFNSLNALFLAWGLFLFPMDVRLFFDHGFSFPLMLSLGEWLAQPHAVAGIAIFFVGMGINLHSDHVIRHLRQPGDTKHYLPAKGMYRYVTSGNYFGELVEWTGFAIAAMTPAAWVFVIWTAANLVPRSHSIHMRYREEFGAAVGNRRRIIPFVY